MPPRLSVAPNGLNGLNGLKGLGYAGMKNWSPSFGLKRHQAILPCHRNRRSALGL